jgi:hypothetical protein
LPHGHPLFILSSSRWIWLIERLHRLAAWESFPYAALVRVSVDISTGDAVHHFFFGHRACICAFDFGAMPYLFVEKYVRAGSPEQK